jgi:translation initiation factor 2 gamma subunit (eIF-2gamma)
MLRITTHENAESLTFQLEGKLAGPWVQELEKCWQNCESCEDTRAIRFDLTGLTFIDAPGKELLKALSCSGVKLMATGCLMRAVVAEITHSPTK